MMNVETLYFDRSGKPIVKPEEVAPRPRRSCYCLVSNEDKVLAVRTSCNPRLWSLPGGGVEDDETIAQGVEREVFEETGVRIKFNDRLIHSQQMNFYADDVGIFFDSRISVFHTCDFNAESLGSRDSYEIIDVKWVPVSEFNSKNTLGHHIRAIEEFSRIIQQPNSPDYP